MQVVNNDFVTDPPKGTNSTSLKDESWKTVEVLEVLLAHSIHLCDLYGNARWQTTAIQIHLIDVLIDRIRALNGTGRPFASNFLNRNRFSQLLRGRPSTRYLLVELLDAHESVLSAALPTGTHNGQVSSWARDFAVGQVVLTNEQQILAVGEQLMHRERMQPPDEG